MIVPAEASRAARKRNAKELAMKTAISKLQLSINILAPVLVGPEQLLGGGREPVIIFVVPVTHWSDGTAAAGHEKR
jgi:hypothetical protein